MNRVFRGLGWMMVALVVCVGVLVAIGGWFGTTPFEHAVVRIDGDEFTLGSLSGLDAAMALGGVLLAACIVVMVALIVVLVAVPMALLVPLAVLLAVLLPIAGVAAFGVGAVLIAVFGVAALVLSPLLLFAWVVWRLARGPRPAARIAV